MAQSLTIGREFPNLMVTHNLKGRAVVAKSPIKKGLLIYLLIPKLIGLDPSQCRCYNCLGPITKNAFRTPVTVHDPLDRIQSNVAFECATCNHCSYCSYMCLVNHYYKSHRYECLLLNEILPNLPTETHELTELLISLYLNSTENTTLLTKISNLTSHHKELSQSPNIHVVELLEVISKAISKKQSSLSSAGEIYKSLFNLYCIIRINANTIVSHDDIPIGRCLDPGFSMINHSCVPNIQSYTSKNGTMHFIATMDIPRGGEILTTYCPTSYPRELRKKILLTNFLFECKCKSCLSKNEYFLSYDCPHCGTFIWSLSLSDLKNEQPCLDRVCQSCHKSLSRETLRKCQQNHLDLIIMVVEILCDSEVEEVTSLINLNLKEKCPKEAIREFIRNCTEDQFVDILIVVADYGGNMSLDLALSNKLGEIITTMLHERIIPTYCFPLPTIINGLMQYMSLIPFQSKTSTEIVQSILWEVHSEIGQLLIDFSLPGTKQSICYEKAYNHLCEMLMYFAINIERHPGCMETENDNEFITMICISAIFFQTQATANFKNLKIEPKLDAEREIALRKNLKLMTNYFEIQRPNLNNLQNWYTKRKYTEAMDFVPVLRNFFSTFSLGMRKKCRFKFANRQYYSFFQLDQSETMSVL